MREDLPTGTVTFLFTDVEGSTRLLHSLGAEAYAEALAEHRQIVREACAAEGGIEVDMQGDAFFFAFSTASGAVAAAQTMTEALAPGQIRLRIGLHTGTPVVTGEGYVGDDVHLAARIAASGHGGQVVLSWATAALFNRPSVTDLGEHRLKDIEEAVAIFQLGDKRFPPLKTISNTNLPRPASSFVGRSAELADVLALVEEGSRLVTLTGPGGSGKTRLALEAAATLIPSYQAGTFWVGFASLRDSALVTESISQTLGAKGRLAEHIAQREMLLLLDNFEHVIDAAPDLSALLVACPNLTLLVTSRELLRVQGEVEYEVPALASGEAVSLFCERSRLAPDEQIAELCTRLDDLPLALELAAARTKALTPSQILERLIQRLDLFRGGRDADPRQRTLRATIEWSYDLLSAHEQRLFGRLSVFAGGCTLEAAEEVCEADLDTLQSLAEKSLLRFSYGRYWMLETIRGFGAERLLRMAESERYVARHAEHYIALVQQAAANLRTGGDQNVWFDRIQPDYPNIRASLLHVDQHDPARLLECVVGLRLFWRHRGYLAEGRRWLERGLQAEDGSTLKMRAQALMGLSLIVHAQGDLDGSWALAEEELGNAREAGDAREVSLALTTLASIAAERHEIDRALALQRESVDLARALEDTRPLAHGLANLGFIKLSGGDAEGAILAVEDALVIHRRRGDLVGQSVGLLNLGAAELSAGRTVKARDSFLEAVGTAAKLGSDEYLAYALQGVAATTVDLDARRAAELLGAADRLLHETMASPAPVEKWVRQEALERVTEALGDALQDAAAAGASLDTKSAIQRALSIQ